MHLTHGTSSDSSWRALRLFEPTLKQPNPLVNLDLSRYLGCSPRCGTQAHDFALQPLPLNTGESSLLLRGHHLEIRQESLRNIRRALRYALHESGCGAR